MASISAVFMTGCQTSSGFKAPSTSNWFSWGKKKPASSTFASTKPDTNLPAPPSGSATPSAAPSYAQSPAARPGAAPGAWPSTGGAPATAANPADYNPRANYSSYNVASAPGGAAPAAGYPQGSGGAAQGFYSPNYRDGRAPASNQGGYGPASGGYAGQNYGPAAATAAPAGGGAAMAIRTAEQHPLRTARTATAIRRLSPGMPPKAVPMEPPINAVRRTMHRRREWQAMATTRRPAAVRGPVHCRRLGNPIPAAILQEATIPPRAARLRPPAARPGR